MSEKPAEMQCPTCKAKVLWNDDFPHRPFCSERCKLIDFGDWASEKNTIAGSSLYDDLLSEDLDREDLDKQQ